MSFSEGAVYFLHSFPPEQSRLNYRDKALL